jgi:hypothetical protein
MPLNPKNELLLAHLRGDEDFEEQLVEYHSKTKAKKPKAVPSRSRRRARWQGRAATASASERGARTAIISAKAATILNSRQPGREGGRAGDVEDKRKAGRAGDAEAKPRRGVPATSLNVLLRADATATTTMHSSLRRPISRGSAQSGSASGGRTA